MGQGAYRNKRCSCGSGLKVKYCKCSAPNHNREFPKMIETEFGALHTLGKYDSNEYPDIEHTFDNMKYAPFYTQDQIIRMNNPANGYDILLKKQADSIAENMRITREMHHNYSKSTNWNISSYFEEIAFDLFFLSIANTEFELLCKNIPFGATFDSDPNGLCIKTEYGNIVTISAVLRRFIYYMNLFYFGLYSDMIPQSVTASAQALALRIMLKTESLDFNMDPRGDIPSDIHEMLNNNTTWGVLFVIAHEFSHIILGHLDEMDTVKYIHSEQRFDLIYNQNQKQELEADLHAIKMLMQTFALEDVLNGAISFFVFLDLYEQAKEQIFPSISSVKTHPPTQDRIRNLMNAYGNYGENRYYYKLLEINDLLKQKLQEDITCNFEKYDAYGSVYLGEWHKVKLVDRVDY